VRTDRIRLIVEIALSIALAAALSLWKITLPWNFAGGSISLVMLPLFVISLRRGIWAGVCAGALFGVIEYFREPYFVHPVQVVLDYSVAFAACGLAGIGAPTVRRALDRGPAARAGLSTVPWVLLGGFGRFTAAFLSGIIFFAANAPEGQPVWLYSVIYNASYVVPSLVACSALTAILVPALERAVPTRRV